ncbi:MAG: outer membrane beta-barrel protein [Bdellovibrionota bacterium]
MKTWIQKLVLFGLATAVTAFSTAVIAAEFNAEVGFRQQSGDGGTGFNSKSEVGYQLGMTGNFDINGPLMFRTGLLYTQRPLTIELTSSAASSAKVSLTYFDVPLTLMYKFEDYGGAYAGIIAAVNLDKNYSGTGTLAGGTVTNAKSMITPFILGAAFKFAPGMGVNIYFESGGDVSDTLKSYRAVGANFMLSFD